MRVPGIPFVQARNVYSDRDGNKYGVAIHATANTASAANEAAYAARRTDTVSFHFVADGTQVIQCLDTSAKAGHAGSAAGNEHAVGVEICGLTSWSRQRWLDSVAWAELGRVLAAVCRYYGVAVRRASVAEMSTNPRVRAFYGHDDMRRAWGGTDHTDPGPGFPWDRLLGAVLAALTGESGEDEMALEDSAHFQALIWRVQALVGGLDAVAGGPTTGEPVELVRRLRALEDRPPAELSDAQVADLGDRLGAVLAARMDAAAEAAVRRVLGAVDGATPSGG